MAPKPRQKKKANGKKKRATAEPKENVPPRAPPEAPPDASSDPPDAFAIAAKVDASALELLQTFEKRREATKVGLAPPVTPHTPPEACGLLARRAARIHSTHARDAGGCARCGGGAGG